MCVCVCVCVCVFAFAFAFVFVDSVGSGAASNVSSPGMLHQHRASSLVESITSDISAVSIGHPG